MLLSMYVAMVILLAIYIAIGAFFRARNARRLARSAPLPARGPRHGPPVLTVVQVEDTSDGIPKAVIVAGGERVDVKARTR